MKMKLQINYDTHQQPSDIVWLFRDILPKLGVKFEEVDPDDEAYWNIILSVTQPSVEVAQEKILRAIEKLGAKFTYYDKNKLVIKKGKADAEKLNILCECLVDEIEIQVKD